MKDPDSYRQQEGLKLTKEERRRNSFPLRFFLFSMIVYVLFFVVLLFTMGPMIRKNFAEGRYIERYRDFRAEESAVYPENIKIFLIGEKGLTETTRHLPSLGRDWLHMQMEALLMPLSEEEESLKLYSAIPENTTLVGISRKDKVILVELSKEFLKAEDLVAASAQVEKTLSIAEDNLRVSIKVGDEII